jgi:uncharacterized protein (TIGR03118 family)
MKTRALSRLAGVILSVVSAWSSGCSDDSPSCPTSDAATAKDAAKDTAADVASDRALDVVGDTATPDASGDVVADGPPADAAAADASDAGPTTQRFAMTILVVDHVGAGDGGVGDAAADAGLADGASTDVGAVAASDAPVDGVIVDPNLVNPWGLAFNPSGPIWVADNHTGVSTIYAASGAPMPLVVTVPPPPGGTPPAAPTGLVFNGATTAFSGDKFIFSTEDGTIVGWTAGTTSVLRVDGSTGGAIYKGLAIATANGASRLFATDFKNARVDVFDQAYAKVATAGAFTDPNVPAGFAPFGAQAIGSTIYVTYAKQDAMKEDDDKGAGRGYVDAYDFDGHLTKRVVTQGVLNSPWGVALAPSDLGAFSGALLVGNFGDGHINAFDATTGALKGPALDTTGAPLEIDGLWAIVFGNDTAGAPHNRLFFTAGPDDEMHGMLGRLDLP